MDLDTENRIASILLKEAAELRRQAQQEGVLAYLRRPNTRGRPNSRFLTATVLGVQQANRNVEENEMWRSRQKEKELDSRLKGRFREDSFSKYHKDFRDSERGRSKRLVDCGSVDPSSSSTSMRSVSEDIYSREDDGLRDAEVEEFLHSRIKRGRGAIGSRMDETGPFLTSCPDSTNYDDDGQKKRVVRGPERPASLMSDGTSSDESHVKKTSKKRKRHSEKHKSKEKSKHKSKEKAKHKSKEKLRDRKKKRRRGEEKRSRSR